MNRVDTIKRWYETMDVDRYVSKDVEWEIAKSFPEAGTYRGLADVQAMFGRLMSHWSEFAANVDETFGADGDRVIALGRYDGTAASTGKSFSVPFAHIWTVKRGRIVKVRHYPVSGVLEEALS